MNTKTTKTTKTRVLFLCTANSARSQMAEAILRRMGGEKFEVYSAGTEATRVNPLTVKAMQEAGYDLSQHFSKTMDRFLGQHFDYVITVCSESEDRCPFFPGGVKREHWPFEDPGSGPGSDSEKLEVFRIVRDQIEQKISTWLEELS